MLETKKNESVLKGESLKQYIDLLKHRIAQLNNESVRIEGNLLHYSLSGDYFRDISSYNQNVLGELGRALAILNLITDFKIFPERIRLEEGSRVGVPSKRVDIKIEIDDIYNERKCIALVECKTTIHKISNNNFTTYFERQLYNIAHSYAKDPKQSYPLILLAYEISFNDDNTIDCQYRWFYYPEIEKIVETGQISLDEIISKNSSFAYDVPPKVTDDKIYFRKKPLTENDLIDIKDSNEFKNLLKEKLHQSLRKYGIVEDKAFSTIVYLLLAKTYDEIQLTRKRDKIPDFQVKSDDYINKEAFYNRIKSLFEDALIQFLGEDPKEARNKELLEHKDREKILLELVPYLQRIRLRSLKFLGEDSVGDIFLDFMHSIFRQSRGLFFTHPNICRFVCRALDIQKIGEEIRKKNYKYILDPSCGSGTFLIEALRMIFKDYSLDEIKENALKVFYGLDNEVNATTLCKVNMVIHGDGSGNIYTRDALLPLENLPLPFIKTSNILKNQGCTPESIKENHGVDFIITNPPFSLEIRLDEYNHFRMKEFLNFKKNTTTASEVLFAERWYQLLNPGGRLGAVLPFSLFDSNEYLRARLLFLCYFRIIAIVGLPEHAFSPHAQQQTVLVFGIRRSLEESNKLFNKIGKIDNFIEDIKDEKIIFYNAKNIGYVRTKKRKTINTTITEENDLTYDIADIIAKAFNGEYKSNPQITIKTLGEISKERKLILTPTSSLDYCPSNIEGNWDIKENWEIAKIEKVKTENINSDILICETGDIIGNIGIITPKKLSDTTPANLERIKRKLKKGNFGKLKEGDIIIAPTRVYQKKIAVITKSATNFLFSKDFIVLRRKQPDLEESFSLFQSLIQDINIKNLESLASAGKSGYSKIKNKKEILQMNFYRVKYPSNNLKDLIELYDKIYEKLFLNKK